MQPDEQRIAANRQEAPDPGSFGGHPYTPEERSLGYGTEHDPRFVDGVRRAQRIARDWNYRYGSLDRPPYPESFLTLEEEQTLIRAIDSLFARLDRAERRRASAIVSRSDVIAAAIDVATNEGLDDDWECVRASDLDRLRVALGLTTGDRDVPE